VRAVTLPAQRIRLRHSDAFAPEAPRHAQSTRVARGNVVFATFRGAPEREEAPTGRTSGQSSFAAWLGGSIGALVALAGTPASLAAGLAIFAVGLSLAALHGLWSRHRPRRATSHLDRLTAANADRGFGRPMPANVVRLDAYRPMARAAAWLGPEAS
jgi:hypothetical protein